jgi:S1-C subfamily serine protease
MAEIRQRITNRNEMMSRLKWSVVCSACLAVAASPGNALAELKPEQLYRKTLPSVMTLEVQNLAGERYVGTAVLALADDIAITAWHVVDDARCVWATFADGQRVKVVGCIDKDRARDLALVKLEKALPHRRATLCRELPAVAARAYVIGAPKGFGFSISDGLISQIRLVDGFPQYQLSCPISPGNSGGPVLNERGEVIGITSWTKADAQSLSFAIPAQELARLNASRLAISWEELAAASPSPASATSVESSRRVSAGVTESGNLDEFKRRLEGAVGKTVTVVLQEDGQQSKFTFTVPHQGLR